MSGGIAAVDVCLYIRMSTNMQEKSVESQQTVLRAYAKGHKMSIVAEYVDEGISGRVAAKRPAFLQMIEDSAGGLFEAVLIYDSSRFARNLEESLVYKSILKRNGVALLSATEPTMDDDTSLITDALFGAMNEMYSRKLAKVTRRGQELRAAQGYFTGTPCFGYKKSNVKGVPDMDEDEARVVRMIFDWYTGELPSYCGIAKRLNAMGLRRGGDWHPRQIKRLLTHTAYTGDNPFLPGTPGRQTPIITREQFERAQEIMARSQYPNNNSHNKDGIVYRHFLSGVFRCARCGAPMTYNSNYHPSKPHWTPHFYFRCNNSLNATCRPTNSINIELAERLVFEQLSAVADCSESVDFSRVIRNTPAPDATMLKARIEQLTQKIRRYSEAFAAGVDTLEEYKQKKTAALSQSDELRRQIDQLTTSAAPLRDYPVAARSVIEMLKSPNRTILEKNAAVRSVIHHIEYDRETRAAVVYFVL